MASSVCDKDNKEFIFDQQNIYNLDKVKNGAGVSTYPEK